LNPFTTLPKLIKSKKYVDEIERDVKGMTKKNWKTSLVGAITCLIALATIWAPSNYQGKIAATAIALSGVGLVAAKDHNN
jgi:hypothetical protein